MRSAHRLWQIAWLALLVVTAWAARAADVPYLTGRVVDNAEILTPATRSELTRLLEAHEQKTGQQIAILTLPSLDGEAIEPFATRVFDAWKLGRKGKDDGVLVIVAPADRRMRIEVGYGLEGTLTDAQAARIIRDRMTPHFKSENYDRGVRDGVASIIGILEGGDGDIAAAPTSKPQPAGAFDGFDEQLPPWPMRILLGAFIFGIIGLFTVIGVVTPGMGWFLYVFLIPFWAMFPIMIVGVRGALILLCVYVVGFPIAKYIVSRRPAYRKAAEELKRTGKANYGGMVITSGGGSSGGGSSGGGGFSGGGGSSGGGGASGSW